MPIEKNCKQCQEKFVIGDDDLAMLDRLSPTVGEQKLSIPAPTLCFTCRAKRRLGWRNERSLYKRKCDMSGRDIVSMYPADSQYTVYSYDEWQKDGWDDKSFGRDYDFSKPFFEQFAQLNKQVPKCALLNNNPEKSDYINRAEDNKNSYMSFDLAWNDAALFCRSVYSCNDITDCTFCRGCSYAYECLDCENVANSSFCISSSNLSDCRFCYNLHGCRDCFLCTNLYNKQYYIENKPYSKEEYEKKLKEFDFGSHRTIQTYKQKFAELIKNSVHRYANLLKCENCTGDYLEGCKDVKYSFGAKNSERCKYLVDPERSKDSMDDCFSGIEGTELNYETIGMALPYNVKFVNSSWYCSDSFYLSFCQHCKNCFGCSGMKRAQYCILNKQYTKEEYEKMVAKIVEQMKAAGEWGEFFPLEISEFAYNESVANEYFPTPKDEVLQSGWRWKDKVDTLAPTPDYIVPDNIREVSDDILGKVLVCEATKRPFKIQGQELAFYMRQGLPIPRKHPDQRHSERFALRNPLVLHHRRCMCEEGDHGHEGRCPVEFETTYAPDRPEKVYCEECYQKSVI